MRKQASVEAAVVDSARNLFRGRGGADDKAQLVEVKPPDFVSAREDECAACCLRLWGFVFCFFALVVVAAYLAMGAPVADTTDMPSWARTFPYLSLAYHLSHWEDANFPPPPPPIF